MIVVLTAGGIAFVRNFVDTSKWQVRSDTLCTLSILPAIAHEFILNRLCCCLDDFDSESRGELRSSIRFFDPTLRGADRCRRKWMFPLVEQ